MLGRSPAVVLGASVTLRVATDNNVDGSQLWSQCLHRAEAIDGSRCATCAQAVDACLNRTVARVKAMTTIAPSCCSSPGTSPQLSAIYSEAPAAILQARNRIIA